jgi:hypothetical protein
MHGLVTINKNNNISDTSQGIFRLRNINIGHTIDYFICKDITNDITNNITNDITNNITDDITNGITNDTQNNITIHKLYQLLKKNDNEHKNNLLYHGKIQCLKYIKRKENKKLDSYKELIYYDTIKYSDSYINEPDFNKKYLFNNIIYNYFNNNGIDLITTHLQVQQQEQQNIRMVMQMELVIKNVTDLDFNNNKKECPKSNFLTIDFLKCNYKNFFKYKNLSSIYIDGDELLRFNEFQIILSLQIIDNIEKSLFFTYMQFYFIINMVDKKILIITIYELNFILHDFNSEFQEIIQKKDIYIYDKYQNIIISHDKINITPIPDYLKIILFENSHMNLFNKFKVLKNNIFTINDYKLKLYFIQSILNIKYTFNYDFEFVSGITDKQLFKKIFNFDTEKVDFIFTHFEELFKKKYLKYKYKLKYLYK